MRATFRIQKSPIGLEIDGDVLRAVQSLPGGAVEAVELRRNPAEAAADGWPGPLEIARLDRVLRRRRFQGSSLVLGVPSTACHVKEVEVPVGASAEEAVRRTAARELASSVSAGRERVLAVTPLPGAGPVPERCFVRGCDQAALEATCQALGRAGWRVVGVRTRADVLASLTGGGPVAWLDIGQEIRSDRETQSRTRATLIVVEAGRPLYARVVRTPLPARLAEASPATADALAAELLPGIKQAERRCAADEAAVLRLVGGPSVAHQNGKLPEGFAGRLAERLGTRSAEAAAPDAIALALGKRLRSLGSVDLLPPSSRLRRRERTALRAALGAVLGYAALVAVLLALWSSAGPAPAAAAGPDRVLQRAEATEARALAVTAAARSAERRLADLRRQAAAAEATADRPDWRRLLDRLAGDSAGRVQLNTVEVTRAGDSAAVVQVSGEAANPRDAWDFALALERGELFDRVDLARTRRVDARPGSAVLFQVQLDLSGLAKEPAKAEHGVDSAPKGPLGPGGTP